MLENAPKINRDTPIPLYFQLKERILNEIKNGNYPKGSMIPTEADLSEMFQLSRTTVRQAIADLVQEGWLYRIKSKGTFIGYPKISQDLIRRVESYDKTIRDQGMIPKTEVLEIKTLLASKVDPEIQKAFNLPPKSKLIYIYRKRYADNEPIVTCKTYLPFVHCSGVLEHDLNQEALYSILSQNNRSKIYRIERTVEAVAATSEDASLLDIKKGTPIQSFVSVGYNSFDEPIEFTTARYRGDRNRFAVTVFP